MLALVLALIFFLLFKSFQSVFKSRRSPIMSSDTSTTNMGFAIRDGFRSEAFPFLETLTPTDLDLDHLESKRISDVEKDVLRFKKFWLSTPYPEQLAAIVARIIEDRKDSPISNAVCLGIGGEGSELGEIGGEGFDVQQFVAFSQIVAQLAVANLDLLNNIYVQDPAMQLSMKALFLNHGCQVVEHPAAFKLVHANTFLVSAFVAMDTVSKELEGRPTEDLAMFMGNGCEFAKVVKTGQLIQDMPCFPMLELLSTLDTILTFDSQRILVPGIGGHPPDIRSRTY